jgi:hypothetical protein
MRQGGRPLKGQELQFWMSNQTIKATHQGIFYGLQGIDAENMAPYFDEALESLVQSYGAYVIDSAEYDRADLRDEAIRRALGAVLVVHGYVPCENMWRKPYTFDERQIERETERRNEVIERTT